jgi:hypothetical protein
MRNMAGDTSGFDRHMHRMLDQNKRRASTDASGRRIARGPHGLA